MAIPDPSTTFSGPMLAGAGNPSRLTSMGRVDDLAAWLLSPHRDRIAVVAAIPVGQRDPGIDVASVAAEHADVVEVYAVPHGELTGRLTSHLPQGCGLSGGGVRIYPVLGKWQGSEVAAPLLRPEAAGSLTARFEQVLQSVLTRAAARPTITAVRHDFPADGVKQVLQTEGQARSLAAFLLDRERTVPVLVVTVHPEADEAFVDADRLARDLDGLAAVVELTADATYGLTEGLGDKRFSAFYGACRVYPVGRAWLRDMYSAPLHMTTSRTAAKRFGPALVEDALMAAHDAGLLKPTQALKDDLHVEARVVAPLTDVDVLLKLPSGAQASMRAAELRLGVPIDRLLQRGQRLTGRARRAGVFWRFFPDPVADAPDERARRLFPEGAPVLARVEYVDSTAAVLQVHPEVAGDLQVDTEDEDLRDLLAVDDIVVVTVSWQDGEPFFALADGSLDGSPGEVLSMPVLPDGPPWLILPTPVRHDDLAAAPAATEPEQTLVPPVVLAPAQAPAPAAVPAAAAPAPVAPPIGPTRPAAPVLRQPPHDDSAKLRRRLDQAMATISDYEDQVRRLQERLDRAQEQARSARAAARKNKGAGTAPARPVFIDPQQQLRHEIGLAYLERFSEPERRQRPLPQEYDLGPEFIGSLDRLQGISRAKVVEVLVEVLVGLDAELAGRDLHPWLEGRAGQQQRRGDGAAAWRVALQRESAGARRLKYWRHPGGRVEFDSVGLHDDGL